MGMTDYMFRIGCAFLMGALIGLERQFRQHNAGLRTNILVALASAAFTVLSVTMTTDVGDPSRVAAQDGTGEKRRRKTSKLLFFRLALLSFVFTERLLPIFRYCRKL